jgi:hypothetical protein
MASMKHPGFAVPVRRCGDVDKLLPFSSGSHFVKLVKLVQPERFSRQPGTGVRGIGMMSAEFTVW